jgi:hypothetical protein
MDINKISSHLNSQLNEAKSTDPGEKSSVASASNKADSVFSDRVSLKEESKLKNEKIFAKIELAKLDDSSFEKLKLMKAKITEFESAKEVSSDSAAQTDIGKLVNDPSVFEEIARKILG